MLNTAVIDDSPVTYWQHGSPQERTLVLLHGLLSDHTGLLDLTAHLTGARVVVPDLPGFGQSPPLPGRHTLHRYADVLEGLREHLGLTRFALVGHSLGADIALVYAGTYPAAVSDLCLLNPVPRRDTLLIRLGELYYRVCAALPPRLGRPLLSSRPAVYLQDRTVLTTLDPASRRRILEQDCRTARLADPRAIQETVRSIRDAPFERYVEAARTRTLLVAGGRDRLGAPDSLDRLPWGTPRPELTVIEDAGHLLPAERPEEVAALIRRFLDASIS